MSNTSVIHHGKGKVVHDKDKDSEEIDIFTPESLSMVSGQVAGWSGAGGMSGYITATWLDSSSANRATPPDVKAGEEVTVFSYAETGKFYWKTERRNSDLRGHETVMNVYKNSAGSGSLSGGITGNALDKEESSTSGSNSGLESFIRQNKDQKDGFKNSTPPGKSKSVGAGNGGGGASYLTSNIIQVDSLETPKPVLINTTEDPSVVFAVDDLDRDGIVTLIEALKYDKNNSIQRGGWDSPLSQSWLREPLIKTTDSTIEKYGSEVPFERETYKPKIVTDIPLDPEPELDALDSEPVTPKPEPEPEPETNTSAPASEIVNQAFSQSYPPEGLPLERNAPGGTWESEVLYGAPLTPSDLTLGESGSILEVKTTDYRGNAVTKMVKEEIKSYTWENFMTRTKPNLEYEKILMAPVGGVDMFFIKTFGQRKEISRDTFVLGRTSYGSIIKQMTLEESYSLQNKQFILLRKKYEKAPDRILFYVEIFDQYPDQNLGRSARAIVKPVDRIDIESNVKVDTPKPISRRYEQIDTYELAGLSDVYS